jgi:lipopolysaccharide transport system permease protein
VPDVAQVVNIALLLLMFISPIAYTIDMVPARARALVYLNPLTYLIEQFRFGLIGIRSSPAWYDGAFLLVCAGAAAVSGAFFRRMSPIFSDYE